MALTIFYLYDLGDLFVSVGVYCLVVDEVGHCVMSRNLGPQK